MTLVRNLPVATVAQGTDLLVIEQAGPATRKITALDLAQVLYPLAALPGLSSYTNAAQGAALVGYGSSLAYPINSVGYNINLAATAAAAAQSAASAAQTTANTAQSTATSAATTAGAASLAVMNLAASGGSNSVGFLQAGTGAVARTLQSKGQDEISVFDFMTVGQIADSALATPLVDATASFNVAHTAAAVLGKSVYVPAGNFLIAGTVAAKVAMRGDGFFSRLLTSSATADVVTASVSGIRFSDFMVNTLTTRSGGYYIHPIGATFFGAYNLYLVGCMNAIGVTGASTTTLRFSDINIQAGVAGGIGITVNTTGAVPGCADMSFKNVFIQGVSSGSPMAAGIQVYNAGDVLLDHVSTVYSGNGLYLTPQSGQVIQSLFCRDSYFDSGGAGSNGVLLSPSGTGAIQLAKFTSVWACTNTNGIVLGGTGTVLQSEFTNVTASNNTTNGFAQSNTAAVNTQIVGGSYSANTNGINFGVASTKFSVRGARVGPAGQFGANSGFGLIVNNSCDDFTVCENDIGGNVANATIGTLPGNPGSTYFIKDNRGLTTKTSGSTTLSSAATTTVVSHGLPTTPVISDISLRPVTGQGTGGAQWVTTVTSTTFTINTQSNPGASVVVDWVATIWGQ